LGQTGTPNKMKCAICDRELPHGNLSEKLCKKELLRFYEKQLTIAQDEIKELNRDLKENY